MTGFRCADAAVENKNENMAAPNAFIDYILKRLGRFWCLSRKTLPVNTVHEQAQRVLTCVINLSDHERGTIVLLGNPTETLRNSNIVVATPEKIDFALRNDATIIDSVGVSRSCIRRC